MSNQLKSVAVPFNPGAAQRASGVVLGASVAVRSFYKAMVEHGSLPAYSFFTAGPRVSEAEEKLRRYVAQRVAPLERLEVWPQAELGEVVARGKVHAYYEPDLGPSIMFRVRQTRAPRPFPITFLHHTFSYRNLLHGAFLRLLLEDTREYDSLICSSTAARDALRVLIDHVADRFEAEHNVRLSYRGRMDVIPLGVDTDLWRPRDRADMRAQIGLPQQPTILLYLGRLSAFDKADLIPLIDAFARLVSDLPNEDLLLILAGSPRGRGLEIVRQHIAVSGVGANIRLIVSPPAPHVIMGAADVFVSPADSIQEAFGLTPVEAMASGVPQVVADWNGYRGTVVDGETGYLVPTMWGDCDDDLIRDSPQLAGEWLDHLAIAQSVAVDTEVLYRRLRELVTNSRLRQQMGAASRRRALEHFSTSVMIARHEALWRELADIADRDQRGPTRTRAYDDPPYFRAFKHYATRSLAADDVVSLTTKGAAVAADELVQPVYYEATGVIDSAAIKQALVILASTGGGQRVEQLEQQLHKSRGYALSRARRHVLWLLKYGLIALRD